MSYYQGDFYRGDYYAGDPFFGGLLAKAASFIVPKIGKIFGGGARTTAMMHPTFPGVGGAISAAAGRVGGMISKHPVLTAAGAAGTIGVLGGGAVGRAGMVPAGIKGFHACKSKHGCKGGALVRNRHMRVTNPRALRRSLRRISGFARIARRVLHFTHPRAARGRVAFRFHRKRKAA